MTLSFAASATAAIGGLTQKPGTAGCISTTGSSGACATGVGLDYVRAVAVSPDGKNVYTAAYNGGVAVFDRNLATGELTQKPGTAGCVSDSGTSGACANGNALLGASGIAVSPDGGSVYVAARDSDAVVILSRGANGELTQDGCISSGGVGGCASAYGLRLPTSVSVSPDGKNLYAASAGVRNGADGVTIFDRSASGSLGQKDGTAGCVSESGSDGNCADGVALRGANSVTVSADGKSVYATSSGDAYTATTSSGVATFDRDSTTGVLTQKAGTAGCVVDDNTVAGLTSCADGVGLDHAAAVSVAPDGTSAYVASSISDNVATFDRDTATGGLAQNAAGNVTLDGVSSVTVSPDGANVYGGFSSGVTTFDRAAATGLLSQREEDSLSGADSVAVSPDGRNAYVAAGGSAVHVFDRDIPPDTTITSGPSGLTSDSTPTFAFSSSEGGSTFECKVDNGSFAPCSGPGDTHTTAALADGPHDFQVRAIDSASNTDPTPATRSFTVDTIPPDTTIDSGPSGITNDNDPSFDFSAEAGASFECRLDGPGAATGSFGSCTSPKAYANLTDGSYTFRVRAIDTVSNTDPTPATRSFTVDTIPPDTTITSGPSGLTSDNTPTFGFSSSEAGSTFECKVDGGSFDPCSGPGDTHTTFALADGPHQIQVRATDSASITDPTPGIRSFTVDATPPDTTINSGPSGITNDNDPSFDFSSEAGASFECRLDGPGGTGSFGSCTTAKAYTDLADGSYTFAVRATDQAGSTDPTPATRSFAVDTKAPKTKIAARPKKTIKTKKRSVRVKVAFSSEAGATFECRLDKASYGPCISPYRVGAKSKGGKGKNHAISIRATDKAGNVGKAATAQFKLVRKR